MLGLFPSLAHTGGIEESGRIAWEAIARAAADATLFCYGLPPESVPAGRTVAAPGKLRSIFEVSRLAGGYDVVLIWHVGLLKLLPFARTRGAKVVLFLHGREIWSPQGRSTRKLLSRVDLFVSNTDHTWERFLMGMPHLARTRHVTCHLGVGTPLEETPGPADPPTAVMLGRLSEGVTYKGHREVIGAWSRVRDEVPGARLWIIGDGEERARLEQLANGAPGVSFLGRLSEDDKRRRLTEAACLALPSRGEGFGLVYVEAMRCGRPCLVGHDDAGREVVGVPEAGLACDPGDEVELVSALVRLLTVDDAWVQMSLRARERYESHFTQAGFERRIVDAIATTA